jgi:hypothetical protein
MPPGKTKEDRVPTNKNKVRLVAEYMAPLPAPIGAEDVDQYKKGAKARIRVIKAGVSLNNTLWSPQVLRDSAVKFEGCKVYYDHKDSWERSVSELVGRLQDVHYSDEQEGLVATLHTLSVANHLRCLLAEQPQHAGFSVYTYVAGEEDQDGVFRVESIEYVRSVDVVDEPAAGGGVIEVLEQRVREGNDSPAEATPASQPDKEIPVKKEKNLPTLMTEEPAATTTTAPLPEPEKAPDMASAESPKEPTKEEPPAQADADNQIKELHAKIEQLTAEKMTAERIALVERVLKEKALKPSLEKLVRKALDHEPVIDETKIAALIEEWNALALELVQDFRPMLESAEVPTEPEATQGIPPAEKTSEKMEARPAEAEQFVSLLFG